MSDHVEEMKKQALLHSARHMQALEIVFAARWAVQFDPRNPLHQAVLRDAGFMAAVERRFHLMFGDEANGLGKPTGGEY